MDKMKDLRAGIEEMRSVAQRLITWANRLEQAAPDDLQAVRSSETSELPGGESRRLRLRTSDMEKSLTADTPDPIPEKAAVPEKPVSAAPSRSDVRALLTKLCSKGYSAQVKALIASYGVTSLSAVPDESLSDLWDAALLLGEEDSGGETNAG